MDILKLPGNVIQLLSFDEVNVWIYLLIHTFTESKDINCFILYFE